MQSNCLNQDIPNPEHPLILMILMKGAILTVLFVVVAGILACDKTPPGAPLPPLPTPLSSSDVGRVELSTDGLLTDMYGDNAVGITDDEELLLVNVRTGEARQLTDDGHYKRDAVLSATHVAWIDGRRNILLPRDTGRVMPADDVFVMDLRTGEQRRITDTPANRCSLRISGSRLVWEDNRNELEENSDNHDIYAYDLRNNQEIPVVVAPGKQRHPAIHGDIVVWSDNRNSPDIGTSAAGCHNLPDRRCDIYSYNLATGEEKLLVQTGNNNGSPSIHGELLAWQKYLEGGRSLVVLLDLDTMEQRNIGFGGRSETRPLVSGSHVVWPVRQSCDVRGVDGDKSATGAFAYRLETGEVRRLSSYVEATTLLHDNVAVVTEGCQIAFRSYAVFLD